MYRFTGSSQDIFFSSTNEAIAATVNDFVNDAASKIVFSSIASGLPNSRTPYPLTTRTFPSFTTAMATDRKSTRLNSSHPSISYAVFCLKKKTHKVHYEK